MSFFDNFFKKSILRNSFDSYNNEITDLFFIPERNKLEFNKNIFNTFQFSSIFTSNKNTFKQNKNTFNKVEFTKQYFFTLFTPINILQLGYEPSGSCQLKIKNSINNFNISYNTVISKNYEIFTQLETIYNSKFYNLVIKLIKPSFDSSNLIYILNYWKTFGKISLGFEIVGLDNFLGFGFSSRFDSDNFISCINLQRFNLMTISFYKKFNNYFSIGTEIKRKILKNKVKVKEVDVKVGREVDVDQDVDTKVDQDTFVADQDVDHEVDKVNYLVGWQIKNNKSEIKMNINQELLIGFSWDEKINENISVGISGDYNILEVNYLDYDYGFSLTYEG